MNQNAGNKHVEWYKLNLNAHLIVIYNNIWCHLIKVVLINIYDTQVANKFINKQKISKTNLNKFIQMFFKLFYKINQLNEVFFQIPNKNKKEQHVN